MKKRRKAIVTQQKDVRTYSELWHASKCVLTVGLTEPKGSSWQFMSSLILTAFSFEAYMNHVGETTLNSWSSLEKLSPLAKLDLLCEVLKINLPDNGKRPRQTLTKLLKFRNTLAHGRTHTITAPPKRMDADDVDSHFGQGLLTEWQKLVKDSKFAERAREDVEAIVKAINDSLPDPKNFPFMFGFGISSASLEPE